MQKWMRLWAALLSMCLCFMCSPFARAEAAPDAAARVEDMLSGMTLREKVGQMFFIRVDSLDPALSPEVVNDAFSQGVTALTDEMKDTLARYPAGGIALFTKNMVDAKQLIAFVDDLQEASSIPLFISCDEEGGIVARLANHPAFALPTYESAAAVGAGGNAKDALDMGRAIGGYMVDYGFNMNFAPVADVNTNPLNPVIGSRAFSPDPAIAAQMAAAMAQGLKQNGVIPVYKHFPGHGDTAQDSHYGLAVSYKTKDQMAACEWLPYQGLDRDVCVMTAHISTPAVTGQTLPATLSDKIIEGILRQELGFEGVVMTDSMSMGAITEKYGADQAAVKAVLAGCDIILGPDVYATAFDAVLNAAETGQIPMERIDESVRRILLLKMTYGIVK